MLWYGVVWCGMVRIVWYVLRQIEVKESNKRNIKRIDT